MKRRKINIAVTGLNAIDSPGPGVPVIRALRDSKVFDVRIIGLSYETLEPGIYMHDLVDKTYQIPFPSAGTASLLNRLRYIHERESLDVIIPNFDAELFNFISLADTLKDEFGIHSFLPQPEQFEERHKWNLPDFGKKYKVAIPKSTQIFSTNAIAGLRKDFGYPMVIKGKYYDATIVYTPEQATAAFNKISAKWGLPILVQEFLMGEEVNVTLLGDGKGKLIGAVPMRKQTITDKGKAWSGISIDDKALMTLTKNLVKATKWKGGAELEIIKTADGTYYLIEINPRFPAWVYLAVGCGQNHPEALVKMALGEKVEPFKKYAVGKLFVRYSYDMIVDLKEFEKISTLGEL